MSMKTLCILGGTGFVGRHLVAHLSNQGYTLKVLTRHPQRHRDVGVLPRAALIQADVHNLTALTEAFTGCDAVINLVGVLHEFSTHTFQAMHVNLPHILVEAVRAAGIKRVLHMSALQAHPETGPSQYLKTKGAGEQAMLQAAGLSVTCFRPSVIFGPDDNFYNQFANLLKLLPVLPLACPETRLAPVYVQDVVRAFAIALKDDTTIGQSYDLCGPSVYTLRAIVEDTAWMLGLKRHVVRMPDSIAKMQGKLFDKLPIKLFTTDNYLSLQVDSVSSRNGLEALGIVPASVEGIMPLYFSAKMQRLAYDAFRRAAGRDV